MKTIITIALLVSNLLTYDVTIAEPAPAPIEIPLGVEMTFQEYANQTAKEHGLDIARFLDVINCESGWQSDIQSKHTYSASQVARNPHWDVVVGQQEQSFGLVQIHLPSHPSITKEQAINPEWAIDWMADRWVEGKQSWWSCY